jgi:small-conductance mechanosensitive channel
LKAALIADIVLALLLLFSLIYGGKRGLMYSLAGLVIVVVALFGASYAANRFSPAVSDWLTPKLENKIEQQVEKTMDSSAIDDRSTNRTADIGELLQKLNVDAEKIVSDAKEKVTNTAVSLTKTAMQSVVASVAYALTYLLAFVLLVLLLKLLLKPLHLATHLPGFHAIDTLGGAAVGFAGGGLILFLAVWLLLKFNWILTDEMVAQSTLLKFFAENSPISVIASL